jgi:hypothetical protein
MQVSNWDSPEDIQSRDRYKEDKALENGYSLIRIKQEEVWRDLDPWKVLLDEAMHLSKDQKCIFDILVKEKMIIESYSILRFNHRY